MLRIGSLLLWRGVLLRHVGHGREGRCCQHLRLGTTFAFAVHGSPPGLFYMRRRIEQLDAPVRRSLIQPDQRSRLDEPASTECGA
jgi:hypothetical protein